jgi:hypothetical protein
MLRRSLRFILFLLYTASIVIILMELGARVWGYSCRYIYDPIYTLCTDSRDIPYVHKPNLLNARARGRAIINTDSLGLRSVISGEKHNPKQPGDYRIAITGDSVTFGEGVVRTEDTFPNVTEHTLNAANLRQEFKVYNYGISAYSVKEMFLTLQYRMMKINPDLVIMGILYDDFNTKRTGVVDAFGYTATSKGQNYVEKNNFLKMILRNAHLSYLVRDIAYKYSVRDKTDHNLPGQPHALPDSYHYLTEFKQFVGEHNIDYVVVLLPSYQSYDFQEVVYQMKQDGIRYLDLSSLWNGYSLEDYCADPFDAHPSAKVHKEIGTRLAAYILDTFVARK